MRPTGCRGPTEARRDGSLDGPSVDPAEVAEQVVAVLERSQRCGEPAGRRPLLIRGRKVPYHVVHMNGDSPGTTVVVVAVDPQIAKFPAARELTRLYGLTRKEAEVALRLARRDTTKEIARDLWVTEHTVRRHTEKVLRKLDLPSRFLIRERLRVKPISIDRNGTGPKDRPD